MALGHIDCVSLREIDGIIHSPIESFSLLYGKKVIHETEEVEAKKNLVRLKIVLSSFIDDCDLAKKEELKSISEFIGHYNNSREEYNQLSDEGQKFIDDMHALYNNECMAKAIECSELLYV